MFDEKTRSFRTNQNIRIKTKDLVRVVLERGKFRIHIRTRIVGGASTPGNTRVWQEWRECGYECRNQERPNGGPVSHMPHIICMKLSVIFPGGVSGRYATRSNIKSPSRL